MALASGTRLGVYKITAQIGEGGMGQVYRATDTKLKRQVAIKILPPSLAADPDRLLRFQREAEVLASLNHPNIAGIYGLEESGGVSALVMELVDGEDLSERIARGPMATDEALPIALQIADALEAAHEQGIIHRDLKPANIKVGETGAVPRVEVASLQSCVLTRRSVDRVTRRRKHVRLRSSSGRFRPQAVRLLAGGRYRQMAARRSAGCKGAHS